MKKCIEVKGIHKFYGDFEALKGISFSVQENEFFAYLGPNGAGKSTTIDILCTITEADAGDVWINGFQAGRQDMEIRNSIGVVFQNSMLDDLLTVSENLKIRCGFYGIHKQKAKSRIKELTKSLGLEDILHQRVSTLSGGQRRRVDIARALIPSPSLLILDEPTTGLDPASRVKIWNTIQQIRQEHNISIFLTTHYMEEAKYADHVCILKNGNILVEGSPTYIKEQYAKDVLVVNSNHSKGLQEQLNILQIPYYIKQNQIYITLKESKQALSILRRIERYISSFEVVNGTLDDAFLYLMEEEDCECI